MDMEEDPATCPEVVWNTLLSSIPNIKSFPNMLGLGSSQKSFSEMNLSSIMGATTGIPTILVDSPIRTSPLPLSPLHPITMSPISKPPRVNTSSISMTFS